MKNILYTIALGSCLLASTSCSDQFLEDKKDYNITSNVNVFSDPKLANGVFSEIYWQMMSRNGYRAAIYGSDPLMRHSSANGGRNYFLTEELPVSSPSGGISAPGLGGADFVNNSNTKTDFAGNHVSGTFYWNGGSGSSMDNWAQLTLYPTTYWISSFIADIEANRSTYPQEEGFWDHLIGQALFARAWLYFDAVRLLGGLPYYTTETNMPTPDDRSPRLTVDESIEYICADFQRAAELLPATWDADNYGRFTSVAALAMISRARLYAASPLFNANWDNEGSLRWKAALDAAKAAEEAANAAGYTGVNSIDEWDRAFYQKSAHAKEGIIIIPKSSNSQLSANYSNAWESLIRPASVAENNCPGIPAPKQMIDLFPMKDGKRATTAGGEAVNGYNPEHFYLNRDPRFYRTFAFSGCVWPGTTDKIWLYAYQNTLPNQSTSFAYSDGTTGANAARQKSKALVWKMSNPDVTKGSETFSGASILEYRYAEILLNLAECYAATGDLGNCAVYLNKIRSRVGAATISGFASKYEALEACLYERRVELAYEGKRSWDCRRWLLYEGGAGFDPLNATDTPYTLEEAWGQGWKLYDGKNGRPNYTASNNVITKLGLRPISGSKHIGEIWSYNLSEIQSADPISNEEKAAFAGISRTDEAGRDAALARLVAFYESHLQTVNPTAAPMDVSYGMDSNNSSNNQATNFRFTWRGWYNLWPIHYNQRIQEASNDWITQNVGWNIGNTSTKDQDGTYEYCTAE